MKKKFLLSSICTILLCVCLISGATFALFTSETKTNITVQSGTVEVESTVSNLKTFSMDVEQAAGVFENGGTASLVDGKLVLDKVAPGDKATFSLTIVNNSNIAIQYRVLVSATGELASALQIRENGNLVSVPEWKMVESAGQVEVREYSICLPKEAGNEYQNKTAEITISVLAVQGNAPLDEEVGLFYVNGLTYATFEDAFAAAKASKNARSASTIYVLGAVNIEGAEGTSQVRDFKGILIEGLENASITFINNGTSSSTGTCSLANLNLKNIEVIDETYYTGENGENAWEFTYLEVAGNNHFENVVFTDGVLQEDGTSVYEKCTFVGHNNDSSEHGNVTMYGMWVYSGEATFDECRFEGTRGLKVADMYAGSDVTRVLVDGCHFYYLSEKPGIAVDNRNGALELTIQNSVFEYTQAGDQGNYMFENDNRTPDTTVITYQNQNNKIINDGWDGSIDTSWYNDEDTEFVLANAAELAGLAELVAAGNTFEGKTIKLEGNIDLKPLVAGLSFTPIGSSTTDVPFKGTFDGAGNTISNMYQSGWDFGYEWGSYGSLGLFGVIDGATIKNVNIKGFDACVEGGDIAGIAGSATGTCVFENITIEDSTFGTYNNGIGGIIGWSGAGNYTFKNITLGEDLVLGGLWGSFDSSVGGVVGQAEPGATYTFENVDVKCRLDVYNDVTAAYKYYLYRMCGMLIGRLEETTTIDGTNYPDMSKYNITCTNVNVTYGEWADYHYCVVAGKTAWRHEAGYAYDGIPADHDHSTCAVACNLLLPFDSLFGGDQLGVKGLTEYAGVTVTYKNASHLANE